jgi:hypothetical protein
MRKVIKNSIFLRNFLGVHNRNYDRPSDHKIYQKMFPKIWPYLAKYVYPRIHVYAQILPRGYL